MRPVFCRLKTMTTFSYPHSVSKKILALGAESAGNFTILFKGKIFRSPDFGNLQKEVNFKAFQKAVLAFLKKENFQPDIILTDLHPHMHTTLWGQKLCKKFQAKHIQVQHHHAHIFSALGEYIKISNFQFPTSEQIQKTFYGIALDGTGYGPDEKIWGGECFAISNEFLNPNNKTSNKKIKIERIGHLENQILLGGELAIQEPARMLISILAKFLSKKEIYARVKKYYSHNEFEILYNQLQQNFNCLETSSAGRILDAVSILLGFCKNKRNYKHEAIDLLEKNSSKPYVDIKPKIETVKSPSILNEIPMIKYQNKFYILNTTYLFEYLIKNLYKDKKRLATTAQHYIVKGLSKIIKLHAKNHSPQTFIAGGITNNKIIYEYLISMGAYANQKIPRGDAGISFGQIWWWNILNKNFSKKFTHNI
jgi:hydrogenase maturation protein HypF